MPLLFFGIPILIMFLVVSGFVFVPFLTIRGAIRLFNRLGNRSPSTERLRQQLEEVSDVFPPVAAFEGEHLEYLLAAWGDRLPIPPVFDRTRSNRRCVLCCPRIRSPRAAASGGVRRDQRGALSRRGHLRPAHRERRCSHSRSPPRDARSVVQRACPKTSAIIPHEPGRASQKRQFPAALRGVPRRYGADPQAGGR